MSARASPWIAWSVCAATLLVLALSMLLIVLSLSTPLPRGWMSWRDQTVSLAGIIGAPILGGLIASRRPRNPYGWLWLGFGLGLALQSLAMSYEAYALVVEPGSLAAPRTISHVLELGGQAALTLASVAAPGLDLYHGGCCTPGPGSLLRQPRPGRRGDQHCGRRRGIRDLCFHFPLCALDRGPLPQGERSRAPTAKVVRAGRRSDRRCHRRTPAISRLAAT